MLNKRTVYKNFKSGQSTVEYIVLVSAVIAVAIAFLNGPNSMFRSKLEGSMNQMANQMQNVTNRLTTQ